MEFWLWVLIGILIIIIVLLIAKICILKKLFMCGAAESYPRPEDMRFDLRRILNVLHRMRRKTHARFQSPRGAGALLQEV